MGQIIEIGIVLEKELTEQLRPYVESTDPEDIGRFMIAALNFDVAEQGEEKMDTRDCHVGNKREIHTDDSGQRTTQRVVVLTFCGAARDRVAALAIASGGTEDLPWLFGAMGRYAEHMDEIKREGMKKNTAAPRWGKDSPVLN